MEEIGGLEPPMPKAADLQSARIPLPNISVNSFYLLSLNTAIHCRGLPSLSTSVVNVR